MFKFALKNMGIKRAKIILIVISVVISSTVAILAYNISEQVDDGFKSTAAYYDMIIGPAGSSTQLAMNTMFFTDKPLGTISYEYFEKLQSDTRVNKAVPFTMGDSYNASKIVGTTPDFLDDKEISDGKMFDSPFEAVIGYGVADRYDLKIGDTLVTSHGLSGGGHAHESAPLTVTGILRETMTAYDNVIFTAVETVWATHGHDDSDEGHKTHDDETYTDDSHNHDNETVTKEDSAEAPGHGDHGITYTDNSEAAPESSTAEEDSNKDHGHGEICAILVKSKSFNHYSALKSEYGENSSLLVINPSEVLREVMENVDLSSKIVYLLCIIILVMNIFIISVITLLNMYDSKKEISLMRLIGIGMNKISLLYIIQNGIIGLASTILSFLASRLCLSLMGEFVASMGIVLNTSTVYPTELLIMAVVFIISVLPTVICTVNMSRKDGLSD